VFGGFLFNMSIQAMNTAPLTRSSRLKETEIERLVGANEQAKAATELTKDHARNMSAPPPGRIDLAPLCKAMSTLRAAGRRLESSGMLKESTIDGFDSTNVEHIMGDVQKIIHQLAARGQLQYKDIVCSNNTVERLTEDVATWANRFAETKSLLSNTLADLKESNSSLSTAEADRDTYKGLYEELQQREVNRTKEKNSLKAVFEEAVSIRAENLCTKFQRRINELQSNLDATQKREIELEEYQRVSKIKLRRLKVTNKRQFDSIRGLERSKDQLRKHHNRLWDDFGSLRSELNAVPAELSKQAITVADLQQQIQELTVDGERDATEILLLQNDIADKAKALERMTKNEACETNGLRLAKKELRRVREDKIRIDSLLSGINVDLVKVMRSKAEAEREGSRLLEEKDELSDKLTESQGHLTKSNVRVSNLESQLSDSSRTIQDQAVELRKIREDLKDQEDKLTQVDVRTTQLSLGVGTLSGQVDNLQKSLTESRNDATSRTQELRTHEEKFRTTQRNLNHQIELCSSQGRLLEQVSTLERQAQDRDALANFLLERPRNGPILRCLVEHDDKEVRLMIRIDQDAREVHCLVLYADHTCEVRRHRMTDCSVVIRNWEPYLTLGRTDPLVLLTDGDGWDWLSGKFEVE